MEMPENLNRLMARVYTGAEIYKGLTEGKLSKSDAVDKILRLSRQLSGSDATTLLRRIQALVVK